MTGCQSRMPRRITDGGRGLPGVEPVQASNSQCGPIGGARPPARKIPEPFWSEKAWRPAAGPLTLTQDGPNGECRSKEKEPSIGLFGSPDAQRCLSGALRQPQQPSVFFASPKGRP